VSLNGKHLMRVDWHFEIFDWRDNGSNEARRRNYDRMQSKRRNDNNGRSWRTPFFDHFHEFT